MDGADLSLRTDPRVGTVLVGRYAIEDVIGEDDTTTFYRAVDNSPGESETRGGSSARVAIRVLRAPHPPELVQGFTREAGNLAVLTSPNTVGIFAFAATAEGQPFMVLDLVFGRSLSEIIDEDGPLAVDRVVSIVAQIGGSLTEAHENGMINGHLTPSSIALNDRGDEKDFVTLIDVGESESRRADLRPRVRHGHHDLGADEVCSPPYASPEQFGGQPLDARSNLYSLAVVAYEMLTGTLPFEASSAFDWGMKHLTVPPKPIESAPHGGDLPIAMRDAIMRALSKSPEQRFTTVREFIECFVAANKTL